MNRRSAFVAVILATLMGIPFGDAAAAASSIYAPHLGRTVMPFVAQASRVVDLAEFEISDELDVEDVLLLALNIYHEARGEGVSGKAAVAHVTLNRLKDDRWPKSMADVILQPNQFSWTRKPPKITDREAFRASIVVAIKALNGTLRDRTGGALYFHAARLGSPDWTRGLTQIARIGAHTFYAD